MNDYIKREDALKLFAGGGKYPEGSFQRRLGELGERLVMQIPFANVVEGDEYDRLRRALAWMWYAYVNKDGECPHDFERRAVKMAEEVLGKWEDCMPQLMRDEGEVDRYAKLLREWEKVSKECAQDAQIAPVPAHGKWIVNDDYYGTIKCSECHEEWVLDVIDDVAKLNYHYCPNCGARMYLPMEENDE